jgi:hypothetical protein
MKHPEAEFLLQYLDGELPGAKTRSLRRHLEGCWQCRAELEELQKLVGDCVRYRQDFLVRSTPQPLRPWSDLAAGFAQIDAQHKKPALGRPMWRWIALAGAAVCLMAATVTWRTAILRPAKERVAPDVRPASPPQQSNSPASTILRPEGPAPSGALRAPETSGESTPTATVHDQLMVVDALHRIGADLGDPIEVALKDGRVVVSGSGLVPERQEQVREAVAPLAQVVVQFPAQQVVPATPPNGIGAPEVPRYPSRLAEQLGGGTQFESISSQLLDHSDAAMTRVYALRRLAQQFPVDTEARLNSADQSLLHQLAREHVEALVREVASLERVASPVLAAIGATLPTISPSGAATDWQSAGEHLFRSARGVETLLSMLLGVSAPDRPTEDLPQQLAMALARLHQDVQQCERFLTR